MSLQKLNDAQLNAVTAPLGPTLVLAGAGSGKTRVLTNRIVYLVKQCNVSPYNILAITFTNKAANEMKERLYEFDCGAQYMHISTIHSFCASVLRREAQLLDRQSNFSIYTEEEKKSLIKKVIKPFEEDIEDDKFADRFCDIISSIKNNATEILEVAQGELQNNLGDLSAKLSGDRLGQQTLDQVMEYADSIGVDKFQSIIRDYQRRMTENNALDFDDLLCFTHKLFSIPEVLERYRERYKYILIDEFQDTNRVQYEIFKLLAGRTGNIFVVGDDDQSIYSWRGADVKNILNFGKDFDNAKVFKLEQNYRSTATILDVANNIIAKNSARYSKKLWTENEKGVKVELYSAYSEQDECHYVLQQINNLRYNGGYKWGDFAILMRVNALSRTFEQQLNGSGIPYKIFGGFKFYERKEVKDVLSYMQIVDNPYNSEALFRALNVPVRRGIGDATIAKLQQLSSDNGMSVMDVISDERNMMGTITTSAIKKLKEFYELYQRLVQAVSTLTLSQFVALLLAEVPFRQTYLQEHEEERAMNIDAFEQSVREFDYQQDGKGQLSEFLQTASLVAEKDSNTKITDYITLATVHAVKGLEFKCVFVVGVDEGIFPSLRSSGGRQEEEERRLMYVALTRACKRLYITRASSRYMYGQRKTMIPSRYFKEVTNMVSQPKDPVGSGDYRMGMDKLRPVDRPQSTAKKNVTFRSGQMVMHPTFGKGEVVNFVNGIVEVVFESAGKKILSSQFAPLTVVEE